MLTYLQNEDGFICAVCEWWICNVNGLIQDGGEYCQIREMWIHESERPTSFNPDSSTIRKLIKKIDEDKFMKSVKWVYWHRRKYDRPSKLYPRCRFTKRR